MSKNLVFTLVRVRVKLSPLIDITVLGWFLPILKEVIAKFTISGVSLTCFVLMRCLNHHVPV